MWRPRLFIRSIFAATTATAVAACATAHPHATSASAANACEVLPAPATPVESATVVVTSPIDLGAAPRATTFGERFVFDLAYDAPTRVDCRANPLGAVMYRMRDTGRSTFRLEPLPGTTGPRITIHSASEARARDLIDAGVDLLLTDNPTLATYAGTRPDVVSMSLAWDETWALIVPRSGGISLDTFVAFRSTLARDVVKADARPAEGPYWWTDSTGCSATATPPTASRGPSRVVYARDEPIAKALAERIVALAGGGATAVGLPPNALASTLNSGAELAYVLPFRRHAIDRCRELEALATTAPWFAAAAISPLIDTRLHAVVKRDRLHLMFTLDSTITVSATRP